MDSYHELGAWILLACFLVVLFLAQVPAAARALARVWEWALVQLTAEPPPDQEALDLYRALRRERLVNHVARLRRILADDSHQSAVRQLGNRLAYGQLLSELAELPDLPQLILPTAASGLASAWGPSVAIAGRGAGQYAPRVETLDLGGWRRH